MAGTDNLWRKLKRLSAADGPSWPQQAGDYGGVIRSGELVPAPKENTLGAITIEGGDTDYINEVKKQAKNARLNRQEIDTETRLARRRAQEAEDDANVGNAQVNGYKKGGFVKHGKETRGKTKGRIV